MSISTFIYSIFFKHTVISSREYQLKATYYILEKFLRIEFNLLHKTKIVGPHSVSVITAVWHAEVNKVKYLNADVVNNN